MFVVTPIHMCPAVVVTVNQLVCECVLHVTLGVDVVLAEHNLAIECARQVARAGRLYTGYMGWACWVGR